MEEQSTTKGLEKDPVELDLETQERSRELPVEKPQSPSQSIIQLQSEVKDLAGRIKPIEGKSRGWTFETVLLFLVPCLLVGQFVYFLFLFIPVEQLGQSIQEIKQEQQKLAECDQDCPANQKDILDSFSQALGHGFSGDDLIKIFVPVMILVFTIMFSASGLKRLEGFDQSIESLRESLQKLLLEERKLAAQEREEHKTDVDQKFKSFETNVSQMALKALNGKVVEKSNEYLQRFEEVKKEAEDYLGKLKPFEWLRRFEGEVDLFLDIPSVGVANDLIEKLLSEKPKKIDAAVKIAQKVIDANLQGTPNDFHNLASKLGRNDLESLAYTVVNRGAQVFPYNVDLRADAVQYASLSGQLGEAGKQFEALSAIKKEHWNWRAFVFFQDYLLQSRQVKEAIQLNDEYQQAFPTDERAYSNLATYYQGQGQWDKVITLAEQGIKNCARAPQCYGDLAQVYYKQGRLDEALQAVEIAGQQLAMEQPSLSRNFVIWQKAAIFDEKINQRLQGKLEVTAEDVQYLAPLVNQTFRFYSLTLATGVVQDRINSARERMQYLEVLLQSYGLGNLIPKLD